ncbi:MAG: 2-amino-4-hydroxy-6-hydroxymethyldihydropteridine diphosphokinase [Pantoea sp. Brub]|nr:2-amino-4-hydroxy-6-hydroxymethyldihydropteridine diphosphokinase [Pantoea sp. Brub]
MKQVYLSLGSNLNNPFYQISKALVSLDKLPQTKRVITSNFYKTVPYGIKDQPDYLNVVTEIKTYLSPITLLKYLQIIELRQGRIRNNQHWGPRILDIDIMLFNNEVINTKDLIIPHYDMLNRVFMLLPLITIAPNISLPNGILIKNILHSLDYKKVIIR